MGYWGAIVRSGAIVSWKLKVVLVGAVRAGKTSLVNGMIHGEPHLCHEDDRTKGGAWIVPRGESPRRVRCRLAFNPSL